MLSVSVLGELSLEADGDPLDQIASHRARSLLGWLAVHPGLHPRARVASVFWPDVLDESARSSLRTTLATLRRELGPVAAKVVTATRERVGIEPGPEVQIDLDSFEQLVSRGELREAAALCRGDLLADLDDDWVNEPREQHRRQLLELLGRIADEAEGSGDLDAALDRTREQVALDPLSEEAQGKLIQRLAAAGDRAGALAAYTAYGNRLRRDLDLTPSAAIRELAEGVRSGSAPSAGNAAGPEVPPRSPAAPVETRYAKSGNLSIAYREAGRGRDVVFVPGSLSHVELGWETPPSAAMYRRLSGFARMITFDKRGMGLSDRTAHLPTLEERMDDVRAVMDAAGCEKAALVGISEGGPMSLLFAATYPERVSALILWGTFARMAWAHDYPDGVDVEEAERSCDQIEEIWGQGQVWPLISINDAPDDEDTRRHLARFERSAATPAMAAAANRFALHVDARPVLSAISAPTLVVHRSGDPLVGVAHGRYLAEHIPGARLAEFPGDFHFSGIGRDEDALDEIEEFLSGAPQEHEIDRALKTILSADIVDSSEVAARLGDRGRRGTLEDRDATVGREIKAHQGHLIEGPGDGLLATFDRPATAIRCAQSLRQSLSVQGIEIQAGLHTGEIELRGEDVAGMAVRIAALMSSRAKAGETLASRTVRDLVVGSGIEFEEHGAVRLEGVPGTWELLAVASTEPLGTGEVAERSALPALLRSAPQTAYVGRVEEHERLKASSREARDGSRRVVFLSGEAGIGKTRLAARTALEAHDDGFAVCWGAASEDLSAPYGPWIQALSHYVEHAPEAVLVAHVDRHGGELARLLRDSLDRRVAGVAAPQQADPETERYLTFEAVVGLLQAAGEHSPVMLVLDDLHWADSESLSLLKHVAAGTADAPLLVLGTYRDSDLDRGHPLRDALADLHRLDGVERHALQGLGVDEVAELVAAATGLETDAPSLMLARELAQETDGNPFFVAEILHHLTESGALTEGPDGRRELRSSIAELGLPHSVREVVCRRVERLGEQPEQILTIGAVAGRTFDVELLGLLVEGGEEELLDALDVAVQASVLVESAARVGRFTFAHPLINHALYDALGATRRSRLHRQVAEGLEQLCKEEPGERLVSELLEETVGSAGGSAAALAYQWRQAGDSERAVDYLLRAAEQAGRGSARAEEVSLYNQALELIPEGDADRRRDVDLKRAVAFARYTHTLGGEGSDAAQAQRGG